MQPWGVHPTRVPEGGPPGGKTRGTNSVDLSPSSAARAAVRTGYRTRVLRVATRQGTALSGRLAYGLSARGSIPLMGSRPVELAACDLVVGTVCTTCRTPPRVTPPAGDPPATHN